MRGPLVLVAWGALLMIHAAVQLLFDARSTTLALLGGAGAACILAGLAWERAAARTGDVSPTAAAPPAPDRGVSHGAPVLAGGIGLAALGSAISGWFAASGGVLVLLGAVLLLTEARR